MVVQSGENFYHVELKKQMSGYNCPYLSWMDWRVEMSWSVNDPITVDKMAIGECSKNRKM